MKGFLVTFEGGEGCGKSTQIKKFAQYLKDNNIDFIISREPGGTETGEKIRELLLHSKNEMSSVVEFLLFSASRAEHMEKVVLPALQQGKVVVLDRFYDSSYVYQGFAGGLPLEDIENVTNFAVSNVKPNLTFVLDISYEEGLKRKSKDEQLKNLDRIEQKGQIFHNKVREGYLKLAQIYKDRMIVVDGSRSIEEVFEKITKEFEKRRKEL